MTCASWIGPGALTAIVVRVLKMAPGMVEHGNSAESMLHFRMDGYAGNRGGVDRFGTSFLPGNIRRINRWRPRVLQFEFSGNIRACHGEW